MKNERELYYGFDVDIQDDILTIYSFTQSDEVFAIEGGKKPIGQDYWDTSLLPFPVLITAPKGYRHGMVVDIGGQDSEIIYLDTNYNVKNFTIYWL